MSDLTGHTISHYTVLEKIGEGGMGVVYKAQDTLLLRFVAIKIFSSRLVVKESALLRFFHEAQTASTLNHPNICAVYDIGSHNDIHFIVMEYIDGKNIREILQYRGNFPPEEVIDIALKVCDALAAAHSNGIIHRDIKPENIMISKKGDIKVMDFGLAKLKGISDIAVPVNQMEFKYPEKYEYLNTSISGLFGTVSYMSPEQIEKKVIDERSDIFSLGIVLYEMLTGKSPFTGRDRIEVLQNILEDNPLPIESFNKFPYKKLNQIVHNALEKNPAARQSSISQLRTALEKSQRKKQGKIKIIFLAFISIFLTLLFIVTFFDQPGIIYKHGSFSPPVLNIYPIGRMKSLHSGHISFSPDNHRIVFAGERFDVKKDTINIWIKDLRDGKLKSILSDIVIKPDWSPDGSQIVYESRKNGIFIVDTTGANIRQISNFGCGPIWSPDGNRIVFSSMGFTQINEKNSIFLYSIGNKKLGKASPDNELNFTFPDWSPDGKWIICTGGTGSLTEIWLIEAISGKAYKLTDFGAWITSPIFCPSGSFIYFLSNKNRFRDLWRVAVNLKKMKVEGQPIQLTKGLTMGPIDISSDGKKIVFSKDENNEQVWKVPIYNKKPISLTKAELIVSNLNEIANLEISPDRTKLVVEAFCQGVQSLLLKSLSDKTESDKTETILYNEKPPFSPTWSPDGKWIAFDAGGGNNADIWRIASKGGGDAEKLIDQKGADWMPTYSPDGRHLCFLSNRSGHFELWIHNLETNQAVQITDTPAIESRGFWSHDGSKIAYFQNATYRDSLEIWIYDCIKKSSSKLLHFYDFEISVVRKLVWKNDDSALYYLPTHGKSLIEISLNNKTLKNALNFNTESLLPYRDTFAVVDDSGYFVSVDRSETLWIAEGLKE